MILDCINVSHKNQQSVVEAVDFFKAYGNCGLDGEVVGEATARKGYVVSSTHLVTPVFDAKHGNLFEIRNLENQGTLLAFIPFEYKDMDSKGFVVAGEDAKNAVNQVESLSEVFKKYIEVDSMWKKCCEKQCSRSQINIEPISSNSSKKNIAKIKAVSLTKQNEI